MSLTPFRPVFRIPNCAVFRPRHLGTDYKVGNAPPLLSEELDRLMLIERTAGRPAHDASIRPGLAHIHRSLVQAIVDRDADSAEYLMKKHIQNGYRDAMRAVANG